MTPSAGNTTSKTFPDWLPYAAAAVLLSLAIIVLTAFAVSLEARRHQERANFFTQNIAGLLSESIDDTFTKMDAVLQSAAFEFSREQARRPFDGAGFNAYLTQQRALYPEITDLRVLDSAGIIRFGTGELKPISLADREHFTCARDNSGGGMSISGPMFTRLSQKWVLVLARPLRHPDGSFAGVVYANLATEYFAQVFSEVEIGKRGTVALRTADLRLVHRRPLLAGPDSEIGSRTVSQQLPDAIAENPQTSTYRAISPLDNTERTLHLQKG